MNKYRVLTHGSYIYVRFRGRWFKFQNEYDTLGYAIKMVFNMNTSPETRMLAYGAYTGGVPKDAKIAFVITLPKEEI